MKINLGGHKVPVTVLESDKDGPLRVQYEGAELLRHGQEPYRWLMDVGSSPLETARSLLEADYQSDVDSIAEDARERIKSGELLNSDELERFLHESVDGSSRLARTSAQREVLTYSKNTDDCDGATDLPLHAYSAFKSDVYDALGDIDELFEPEADDGEDENDE